MDTILTLISYSAACLSITPIRVRAGVRVRVGVGVRVSYSAACLSSTWIRVRVTVRVWVWVGVGVRVSYSVVCLSTPPVYPTLTLTLTSTLTSTTALSVRPEGRPARASHPGLATEDETQVSLASVLMGTFNSDPMNPNRSPNHDHDPRMHSHNPYCITLSPGSNHDHDPNLNSTGGRILEMQSSNNSIVASQL